MNVQSDLQTLDNGVTTHSRDSLGSDQSKASTSNHSSNRREEALREMRRLWPIVTDSAFESIEDDAMARLSAKNDPLVLRMLTALKSLRQEVAQMEHVWLMFNVVTGARLAVELDVKNRVIEMMLEAQ